ncbi:MAG: Tim44 domain-containing protein [Hyphomonadaceae bacterium]|nr:Tim44 domain-containing protein [Hyphomonadaceae bacterium]
MNTQLIELLVLAIVAGVVLAKLYSVLGRRTGAERPTPPAPPQTSSAQGGDLARDMGSARAPVAPPVGGPASGGLGKIMRADPSFDPSAFVVGARGAYEMIVGAFASGDRETLKPLLTDRVFAAYAKAIDERNARGEKGAELVRLKTAEIADADLAGETAQVAVKFEAELAEGATGLRDTAEKWTFERDVRSADPNWKLARVVAA